MSPSSASQRTGIADFVQAVLADRRLGPQVRHVLNVEGVEERFGKPDPPLPPALDRALAQQGVKRLWSHQCEALTALEGGRDVLLTTPTASGKSLVFQLPPLQEALVGGPGRALYLYPLKALGRDQRGKFLDLAKMAGLDAEASCEVYDGDTPRSKREAIRREFPRVVVSNPDMLHAAILAYPQAWEPFLENLRWVVLDELHTYRGVFGSHIHHVLQRLHRACRRAGSRPQFITSSATASNAAGFAGTLAGREFVEIADSGAPREGRRFLLVQPEASPYTTALHLLLRCLDAGLKTIVFTKARRITELLYTWASRQDPRLKERVSNYRAGFLPEDRRRIERDLFEGRLDAVISTSALELGIDVGAFDACILVGYPGSVMSTLQRSGRVGRRGRDSVTAMVALPDALDQYFLRNPEQFLGRPCENLVLDPGNVPIARAHLACAAAEAPLRRDEDRDYLDSHAAVIEELKREAVLVESAEGEELYSLQRRPQRNVNIRSCGETYAILDSRKGKPIGTIDGVRALFECHPGAVYLHAGQQYLVQELDREARKVHALAVNLDYFTAPLTEKETEILEVFREKREGPLQAWLGKLKVTERVVGYQRRRIAGQESIDQHSLDLPPVHFETVGTWWSAPHAMEEAVRGRGEDWSGALHATEHAAISMLPLFALCDRQDVGGISYPNHPQVKTGAVFVYDGVPGGVGLTVQGYDDLPQWLAKTLEMLESCPCETGCPGCVQSPKCGAGNKPLDKEGSSHLLRMLLGREKALAGDREERGPVRIDRLGKDVGGGESEKGPQRRRRVPKKRTLVFDLETKRSAEDVGGWGNIHRMGLALGVTFCLEEDAFHTWFEDDVRDLEAELLSATLVVGFNVKRFDYTVLRGYTGRDYAAQVPTLDMLEEIHGLLGFRLSLGHLAQETLGFAKSADGLQSLEWFKEGKIDLIEEYCRKDVEITRDLWLHGREKGYVLYKDLEGRRVKLPVQW